MRENSQKMKILFVCNGNACRSQLAEGWCRFLWQDRIESYSAGISPHGFIDPRIIKVMAEAGIDLSAQWSKPLKEYDGVQFDYVITLCGGAQRALPTFPGNTELLHAEFPAPPQLAAASQSEEEALVHYRTVRDAIRTIIEELPRLLLRTRG